MKIPALCLAAAFVALAAVPSWSAAMDEAACTAWLTKVDANADGKLDAAEATPFLDKLTTVNVTPKEAGVLSKEEFMLSCTKGDFEGIAQ
jgi:hypothetical protein